MNLAQFFFTLQNQLKMYHWQTYSYSRHIASDSLYSSIIALADSFMEIYQGKYGRIQDAEIVAVAKKMQDSQMIMYLREASILLQQLEEEDSVLVSKLTSQDKDLLNIRDEIVGKINQTVYLFELK